MRSDKTQPDFMGIPILSDGAVMFCTAEQIGNKPTSCYTCTFQNGKNETCQLIGDAIQVAKVTGDDEYKNPIEYWPCCGEHNYGEPNSGAPTYIDPLKSPDQLGLVWINASEPGQEYGGANCAGVNGGDDCDHYQVESGEKWDSKQGFCRVLQQTKEAGGVCAAWGDDDILSWQEAQQLMGNSDDTREKKKLAKDIIGREGR